MLSKKSPRRSCGIRKRNDRIDKSGLLIQRCALAPDLESILRGRTRKVLFRQHRSRREKSREQASSQVRNKFSSRSQDELELTLRAKTRLMHRTNSPQEVSRSRGSVD